MHISYNINYSAKSITVNESLLRIKAKDQVFIS